MATKQIFCKFCGNAHSLCEVCDEKKAANNKRPPNGAGSITVSRKDEVNRVDGEFMEPDGNVPGSMDPLTHLLTHPSTDTHEDISKSNEVTKTMGPGYPEVIGVASQIESSSNDSVNSCTHNKDTKIDQVASQIERSDQDNGSETAVPEFRKELQNEVPPVTGPVSSRPLERPPVLIAPTATMQPCLSLLTMLRQHQAVMTLWSLQIRMILQY